MSKVKLQKEITSVLEKDELILKLVSDLRSKTNFKTETSILSFIKFIPKFLDHFKIKIEDLFKEKKINIIISDEDVLYFFFKKNNCWSFFLEFLINNYTETKVLQKDLKKRFNLITKEDINISNIIIAPKEDKGIPTLNKNELELLYNNTNGITKFLFLIYITTGMRKAALLNCNLLDITFENNILRCIEKGNVVTNYIINPEVQYMILKNKIYSVTEKKIYYHFNEMKKILNRERFYPHLLRFTFSKLVLNHTQNLSNVQISLGHKNIETTQNSYIKETNLEKVARLNLPWLEVNNNFDLPFFLKKEHIISFIEKINKIK